MTELLHPPWCIPDYCDAACDGAHRGHPVPLDLSTVVMWAAARSWCCYLYQPVMAVGAATTYLRLERCDGGADPLRCIDFPLGAVSEMAELAAGLVAEALEQGPRVKRGFHDDPAGDLPENIEGLLLGWGGCRSAATTVWPPRFERVVGHA